MKLYLLRHGQTEGSLRDLYYGAANIPVLPESLEELHTATCRTRSCRVCGRWISAISRCTATRS